ncbi:MAG TPA: histidine kinase dimerization/phospho-acceptor domain-containing protein [Terriglobales bacterium]|nr:histidine kinase dimerization/phospho-acceptor domain-containing protein [Terriglobales bacterium]
MSERSKLWVLAAAGLVFAQTVASLLLRAQTFELSVLSDITQCILLLSGTAALLPNIFRSRGRIRLFWALMTLGLVLWLFYQVLWIYFEVILRREMPDPYFGDIILFLHIVPMMAALALQPHMEQDERASRLGTLDFALLLVWWVYLYCFAVLAWQYGFTSEQEYSRNLNVLYLTEKMVFLAGLALAWLRSTGSWRRIYAHWFGASLMYSLGSYIANWAIAKHVYYTGSLYDIPLALSMAWITCIGLMTQEAELGQQKSNFSNTRGVRVARLGMIAIFTLPLFAAWALFDTVAPPEVRNFRLVVTLLGMIFMGAMVFMRQHLLDRELLHLLRSSEESFHNLKRLQGELVQSEKLASLGQLVGGAAHELNNPLTAMLGYSDLLTASPLVGEQKMIADKIAQQVRRTKALVSSLLSFAKRVPAEKVRLDINVLAQTALKLSEPELGTRKIEVKVEAAPDLPKIWGDSNQLLQVCLHIISNATHALEVVGGGVLFIRTRLEEDAVILEFSENGAEAVRSGIAAEDFDLTPRPEQALGLGLSACYGIIQEHRGRILCQKRAAGATMYRIEMPFADPVTGIPVPARPEGKGQPLKSSEDHGTVTLPLSPLP